MNAPTIGHRARPADCAIVVAAAACSALAARVAVQRPDLFNLAGVASPQGLALLLLGLVLGGVCLRFPDAALCCLVAFVYLNLSDVLVRGQGLPSLLQLSFVPLALAGWWSASPGSRLPPRTLTLALCGYVVVVLCSTSIAADRAAADQRLLEHLRGLAIFAVVVLLARSPAALRRGAWTLVTCAALLGGLALVHVLTGDFTRTFGGLARVKYAHIYGTTFEPRIAGPLGDPNFFAQILIVAVPLALYLAWTEDDLRRRLLAFCAAGLAAVATVFTYSRGGALALFAVLLLSVIARGISLGRIALGAVPVLAVLWVVVPDEFAHRLTTLSQLLPGSEEVLRPDSSFGERKLFTAAAVQMFDRHPLLGIGAGNYGFHFVEYAQQVGSEARLYVTPTEGYYPHNLYLEVAAETGVLGLIAFGLALAACYAYLYRARLRFLASGDSSSAALATAFAIGLGGYLLSSLFLHGHFIRYWWLMAGFAAGFHRLGAMSPAARHLNTNVESVRAGTMPPPPPQVFDPAPGGRPDVPPDVRPAIAVLVSRFPLITETFILREIIEMERQGQPVLLVPLLKETPAVVHREAVPWTKRALHTPFFSFEILRTNLRMLRRRPSRYVVTLGRIVAGTIGSPNFLVRSLALFPKAVFLAERLEREGIRHLHAHYATHPTTVALIASSLSGMTFSFTVHAHDVFVRRSLLRWKVDQAAFVRAISQFNRDFLARHYPETLVNKVRVVHVGINPGDYGGPRKERADQGNDVATRERRILCVASLQHYKGIPVLLDACVQLRRRGLEFTCTVVGEGPMRPALEARIAQLRLDRVVTLAGARPQHEVAGLMRNASLLAMPSIVAPDGQMEGIPVAIMEAMAARLPVVASSLSGIPEAVVDGKTGLLVPPGRASELALAIEALLADTPDARERMGDAGRAAIEREFRLDACVAALLRCIDRHNPCPSNAEMLRQRARSAALPLGPLGLRRLQERRDSRVAQVIVPNGGAPHELVLKTHKARAGESRPAAERARREFEMLQFLRRVKVNGTSVPRPVHLDLAGACVVMDTCRGESLDTLIRASRLSGDASRKSDLESAVRRAGMWLQHFQESSAAGGSALAALDRLVWSASAHLESCDGGLFPASTAALVRSQLDALRARLAPSSLRLASTHGDYWPGNIFVDDDIVQVIDFEGVGEGLPYEDVAYFLVQLELFFPGPILHREFQPLAAAFLAGCLPARHGFDWACYELCRIAAALKILGSPPFEARSLQDRWRRRMLRSIVIGGAS